MARKKIKTNKSMTITEFKFWLKGLVEFQPDSWAPSKEQWKTIEEKIFNLKNDEETETPVKQLTGPIKREIEGGSKEPRFHESDGEHNIQPPKPQQRSSILESKSGGKGADYVEIDGRKERVLPPASQSGSEFL